MKIDPIQFPVLCQFENELLVAGKEMIGWVGLKHEGGNVFTYLESAKKTGERFHWLIGADGLFREFRHLGVVREWARWLKPLIVLTRVRCELTPSRVITAGELCKRVQTLASGEDFQHEKDLLELLRPLAESQPVTRELFLQFMGESPDVVIETLP